VIGQRVRFLPQDLTDVRLTQKRHHAIVVRSFGSVNLKSF
jgi:hypothetical protein